MVAEVITQGAVVRQRTIMDTMEEKLAALPGNQGRKVWTQVHSIINAEPHDAGAFSRYQDLIFLSDLDDDTKDLIRDYVQEFRLIPFRMPSEGVKLHRAATLEALEADLFGIYVALRNAPTAYNIRTVVQPDRDGYMATVTYQY